MKHIKKIKDFTLLSGLGVALAATFSGCLDNNNDQTMEQISQKEGVFLIVEETSPGRYKIADEFPSNETRVVLKSLDGNERVLTKAELDELMRQENAKLENGTSNLTKNEPTISSGGLSLGEAILASAAGAIIGSWIGSKLFNSPGYQNHRQNAYKNPSGYSKSVNSFNKASTTGAKSSSGGKSGFFGSQSSSSKSVSGG